MPQMGDLNYTMLRASPSRCWPLGGTSCLAGSYPRNRRFGEGLVGRLVLVDELGMRFETLRHR
jgi:hypothetical protein